MLHRHTSPMTRSKVDATAEALAAALETLDLFAADRSLLEEVAEVSEAQDWICNLQAGSAQRKRPVPSCAPVLPVPSPTAAAPIAAAKPVSEAELETAGLLVAAASRLLSQIPDKLAAELRRQASLATLAVTGSCGDLHSTRRCTEEIWAAPRGTEGLSNMQIRVRPLVGQVLTFRASPASLVGVIKTQIQDLVQIPACRQLLFFAGKLLDDSQSLSDVCIREGSAIHLLVQQQGPGGIAPYEVVVATLAGKQLKIKGVFPFWTVAQLKSRVAGQDGGTPAAQQRLITGGRDLDDDGVMMHRCGVMPGSILHMVPRTGGGTVHEPLDLASSAAARAAGEPTFKILIDRPAHAVLQLHCAGDVFDRRFSTGDLGRNGEPGFCVAWICVEVCHNTTYGELDQLVAFEAAAAGVALPEEFGVVVPSPSPSKADRFVVPDQPTTALRELASFRLGSLEDTGIRPKVKQAWARYAVAAISGRDRP